MAVEYVLWLAAVIVLALPWNQKYTGTWNKIKKWYNYLLAALVLGLIPMVLPASPLLNAYGLMAYAGYFCDLVEAISLILGVVGVVGIAKELLLK